MYLVEAFVLSISTAENVIISQLNVVEEELGRILRFHAHLLQLVPFGEPIHPFFHKHQRDAVCLQNATTPSEERTSAEGDGSRPPHREDIDGLLRPPLEWGMTQSISVLEQILGR